MKAYAVLAIALMVSACTAVQGDDRDVTQLSGGEMYQRLCASCHGVQGNGDGPVSHLIKVGVPNLTRITARNGGEFPAEEVHRTIDGRLPRPAHGPRDMPVWGWHFYDNTNLNDPQERARVDAMIRQLVDYIRSIQKE